MSDNKELSKPDKDTEKKERNDSVEIAGLVGATAEKVKRYGSANKEHLVSCGGVDNATGTKLKRSLMSISKSKVDPKNKNANLKQQAGFSAEVAETARTNAGNIISGNPNRKIRSDDRGKVNDPLIDHWVLDENRNPISGSGTQMKFVGSDPQKALDKLMSKDCQKYIDNDIPFEVPSDYFDEIKLVAENKIKKLEKNVANLEAKGQSDLARNQLEKIKKLEKIKNNLKKSNVSKAEALEARTSPKIFTAKEVARESHRGGVEAAKAGAAIGGGMSLIRNVIEMVKDDKKAEEALVDIVKDTATAAALSYGTTFIGSALKGAMQNSTNQIVRSLSKTNLPAMVVASAFETVKDLVRLGRGDITETEFYERQGKGLMAASAGAAGASVGMAGASALATALGVTAGTTAMTAAGLIGGLAGGMIAGLAMTLAIENGIEKPHQDLVRNTTCLHETARELAKTSQSVLLGQMLFTKFIEADIQMGKEFDDQLDRIDEYGREMRAAIEQLGNFRR